MSNRPNGNQGENQNGNGEAGGSSSSILWGTTAALGALGAAAAAYWFTRPSPRPSEPQDSNPEQKQSDNTVSSYLSDLMNRVNTGGTERPKTMNPAVKIPDNPVLNNLNALLQDIYVRYVALKDDDFELHYGVFNDIFMRIHKTMKEVDPYYDKYSSRVQFAGSHYDNLRIKKPDEFDMDIMIDLPLCINNDPRDPMASDIILESKGSGFVQLKMGVQFQKLPMRDGEKWLINKTAYEWKDDKNYLLRSKFTDWFKSVVDKALNKFQLHENALPIMYVNGVPYTVRKSESGPAKTLFIENRSKGFKMDVDLVPALKFPEGRWPPSGDYRKIPDGCRAKQGVWMVVPKPNKAAICEQDKQRSWRLALHDQERGLMYKSYNMKQAIRLMKKLRDSMEMSHIASYYVKTLFFWETENRDPSYWQKNGPAKIFADMVKVMHQALLLGKIPYYWNKRNNLIGGVDKGILTGYASKLQKLIDILDQPSRYKEVAKFILTPSEYREYNSRFLCRC